MERPPRLQDEIVEEFVAKAHGDLERVRELLGAHPQLANATWDWGGGDFETALGAAAHMGRRDIARLLLEHGARKDLFAAAMLGELELVRAFVDADAAVVSVLGPHGIPLLAHAQAGGEVAAAVVDYLMGLDAGGAEGTAAQTAG